MSINEVVWMLGGRQGGLAWVPVGGSTGRHKGVAGRRGGRSPCAYGSCQCSSVKHGSMPCAAQEFPNNASAAPPALHLQGQRKFSARAGTEVE